MIILQRLTQANGHVVLGLDTHNVVNRRLYVERIIFHTDLITRRSRYSNVCDDNLIRLIRSFSRRSNSNWICIRLPPNNKTFKDLNHWRYFISLHKKVCIWGLGLGSYIQSEFKWAETAACDRGDLMVPLIQLSLWYSLSYAYSKWYFSSKQAEKNYLHTSMLGLCGATAYLVFDQHDSMSWAKLSE